MATSNFFHKTFHNIKRYYKEIWLALILAVIAFILYDQLKHR